MRVHFLTAVCKVRDCKIQLTERLRVRFARGQTLGYFAMVILVVGLLVPNLSAQGLDPAALLRPATDTWPTYNGDYSGKRFSTLDQINAGNVGSVTLAWVFRPHASSIKSTPLEVNG